MAETDPKILELEARLDSLVRTQIDFQVEITAIRKELSRFRTASDPAARIGSPQQPARVASTAKLPPVEPATTGGPRRPSASSEPPEPGRSAPSFGYEEKRADAPAITHKLDGLFNTYTASARENLEKFIGENLISKIGIIVLVLGVGIGAKYAIDNGWISPLLRIIFGYAIALALLGFAITLKPRYHNFSAVLASGGMAVMYFITYFAYASYQLISQPTAFAVMAMSTVFTVAAAILYDRQVIAHIGLVGAYAVPFLLSNNSGNYAFLFSYMTILNGGILAVSVKRVWKPIFYTASAFTWVIFGLWFLSKYDPGQHLHLALVFATIFFAIFYTVRIIYGTLHPDADRTENIASAVVTALIFYWFCGGIVNTSASNVAYSVIFGTLAAVAAAILVTSYRFYGRILVFVAYPATWLIFASWFFRHYKAEEHFLLATVVATLFFGVFYGATLIYRLATGDTTMEENAGLILTNSFVFYGFGYAIMDSRAELQAYEGLFTAAHGIFHSAVAHSVGRIRANAIDVVQVLTVLTITFATLAIPIQFDGNVVTSAWAIEASVLFFFGRVRGVRLFEYLSYPVMVLASCAMVGDWMNVYSNRAAGVGTELLRRPWINGDLVTAIVFTSAAAFVYLTNRRLAISKVLSAAFARSFGRIAAVAALFVSYNAIRMEIGNSFHLAAALRGAPRSTFLLGTDLGRFDALAQIDFTLLFLTVFGFVNLRRVKSSLAGIANVGLALCFIGVASTYGMFLVYELRASYLGGTAAGLFGFETANISARYVTYAFIAGAIAVLFEYSRTDLLDKAASKASRVLGFDAVLYPTVLVLASCELMNIAAHLHISDADRFGLSILWGVIALAVVAVGIALGRKHLRVGAMVLIAITLAKLFFYDITDLGTIAKTLLFMSLGLLLLIISFLYNKYKVVIFGSDADEDPRTTG